MLRYVDELRRNKFEPRVAPGPAPELLRVLVGPFPDRDSLTKAKADLDAAKIDCFVRAY